MVDRRNLLKSGGALLACLIFNGKARANPVTHIINMHSDQAGGQVWFDPVGLFVLPGDTVRWIIKNNVHTVASYHPENDNHALRMPRGAQPWNSGYLVNPGDSFEVTMTVPGVYDYYCEPHEQAGMVGRIVVGDIRDPGASDVDAFKDYNLSPNMQTLPPAAQNIFPSPQAIITEKRVHLKHNITNGD